MTRESIPWIMERLSDKPNLKILDVGGICRHQIQSIALALLDKKHIVITVDIDSLGAGIKPLNWTHLKEDVLNVLPRLANESFDVVLGVQVLQHIGMPWRGMDKVINNDAWKTFLFDLWRVIQFNGSVFMDTTIGPVRQVLDWDAGTSWHIFTENELRETTGKLGFKWIDHMIYDGANDSKKRVKEAKSMVMMLQKEA